MAFFEKYFCDAGMLFFEVFAESSRLSAFRPVARRTLWTDISYIEF
jgi:hypothetical protein